MYNRLLFFIALRASGRRGDVSAEKFSFDVYDVVANLPPEVSTFLGKRKDFELFPNREDDTQGSFLSDPGYRFGCATD